MNRLFLIVCVISLCEPALAERVLNGYTWVGFLENEAPEGIEVEGDQNAIVVRNSSGQSRTLLLLRIENPGIETLRYAIVGQVKTDKVEGKSFLEMWNHLPGGKRAFTRTLAKSGPLQSLEGTSDWRTFVLPFTTRETMVPEKLELNLVFAGKGTVSVGPVRLVEYQPEENPLAVPGQWFPGWMGGLLGGILGTLLGCLGALIGWLSSRGRARGFVFAALKFLMVLGAAGLAAGGWALIRSQPFGVSYPILLGGLLCLVIPGGLYRSVTRRYDERELRKTYAQDAV